MALSFRELLNSESPAPGKEYSSVNHETEVGPKEEGNSSEEIPIFSYGSEDYTPEKITKEQAKEYEHLGQLPPDKKNTGEYSPSKEYIKYQKEREQQIVAHTGEVIDKTLSYKKIERVQSVKTGDTLEVVYAGKSTLYNITSVLGEKVTYTRGDDKTPRETTIDSLGKIVTGPGVAFAIIGEKEKLQLAEFDQMIEGMKAKEQALDKNMHPLEQIEHMRDMLEEYSIPIAYIEPIHSKEEKEYQERVREQARAYYEEREEVIENIGKILKSGIDKVVIHGNTIDKGDEAHVEAKFAENIDLDTRGALFLLGMANGVKYNEGSYTELTKKGQKGSDGVFFNDKKEEDQTTLYIDTSGEQLDYETTDKGVKVFIDHHQKHFSKYATSATELAYEVLIKNKMIEAEPWMDNMVKFVTSVDNLTYANREKFDEDFLEKQWPKSMFGIYKNIPFEKISQWFKESKNPLQPEFSEEELNEVIKTKAEDGVETKFKLRDLIEQKKKEIGLDIINAKLAIKIMESRGLKLASSKVGKVIYNKQDRQKDILKIDKDKNPTNKIYNGFLVAKALGFDTYATYNEKYSRFMVNTNTYDIYPLYQEMKKVVPEAVLVRGVMLIQPPGMSNRKDITEDKFLEILGLKDK